MSAKDRRHEIMQAAEGLFRNRRFHEVTLDEVAQKARVGKGTIYRYFRDKDDLFFQTASSGFDDLCELLRRKVSPKARFRERLLSACVEIGKFHGRRRELVRMMQAEEGQLGRYRARRRGEWLAERKKLVSAVAEILRQGAREGEVRTDVPAEVLAGYLLGMLRTRVHGLPEASERFRSRETLLELYLHGVWRPRGGRRGHGDGSESRNADVVE
jgi:AcrR family transcriptional regulator